jgi:small-conductance mechanosensitive channel
MGNDGISNALMTSGIVAGIALAIYYILFFFIRWYAQKKKGATAKLFDKHIHGAGLLFVISIIFNILLRTWLPYVPVRLQPLVSYLDRFFIIIATGNFIIRSIAFGKDYIISRYERREYKDYTLRSVRTKFNLIQRMLKLAVIVIVVAALLASIPRIKEIGNTLLASAGVAGIILGFAAQKSLSTLFAGIQIAVTQPIKIDDTVVIDDQFGTIGEITLTYVVVNTWDEKRLIVPINRFLDQTTENWTRESPEVVGAVKIRTDYKLPIDDLRREFKSWLEQTNLWDKRKSALLITAADDKTMEVRATMSSKDSDDSWDLQCLIREKMITYIRDHYPDMLPTARVEIKGANAEKKS